MEFRLIQFSGERVCQHMEFLVPVAVIETGKIFHRTFGPVTHWFLLDRTRIHWTKTFWLWKLYYCKNVQGPAIQSSKQVKISIGFSDQSVQWITKNPYERLSPEKCYTGSSMPLPICVTEFCLISLCQSKSDLPVTVSLSERGVAFWHTFWQRQIHIKKIMCPAGTDRNFMCPQAI